LFRTFFYAWYGEDDRSRHPDFLKTDLEELELPDGADAAALCPIDAGARAQCEKRIADISAAAVADLGRYINQRPPVSPEWITVLDEVLDEADILRILQSADAKDYSNPYLVFTCELGALTALRLTAEKPRLTWLYDHPYWESALFDRASATRIPVFHWGVKRMSSPGFRDRLSDKIEACLARLGGVDR
jgi:hypothetical protein